MNSAASSQAAIPAWKWGVVFMMLLATVVNYMDRQALAAVSSYIKRDFHLNEEGYGTIEAWFGYSYALFLVLAGFLADRWSLRWLYAGALLVWSAAGMATGYVRTLTELLICRAVLGAGEAFNWPVAVAVVGRIIPRDSQGFANGVFNSGMTLGAVLTPVLVLVLVGSGGEGWPFLFKVVGAVGSVWVVFWLLSTRGERAKELTPTPREKRTVDPGTSLGAVVARRTFWIAAILGITVNMSWHFYRVWLPRHLVLDLGFTDRELQYLLMSYFLTADLGSIAFGFAAKRLVGPDRSVEKARKVILILASLLCLIATPIVFRPGRQVMVPLYCLVGAGIMGVFAMWYAYIQEIAPGHTSKCLGLIGALAWFINSRLHPLVGHFADTHSPAMGKFAPMILVAGMLPLVGALFALTWPDNQEPGAA